MPDSTNTNSYKRGSEWSKWDLHIHTPSSIVQQYGGNSEPVWQKFISDLEKLPDEFSVLGINDYLFLDGYERLKEEMEKRNRLKNIKLILPVVEFRIEKFAGVKFGNLKRINLHVIFSNELLTETIRSQFLNTLQQSYKLDSGEDWTRAITRDSLEDLGNKIKKSVPESERSKYGSDLAEGFNNLNVDERQISEALKKDCFKGKFLIAIGKSEWDSLGWSDNSIASKKTIINRADIVFTASESVETFHKAKESLQSQNVKDLLLDCSDAHCFSSTKNKDRIGNCNTWIKAIPTFEGLKQIIYEPDERVKIQELHPDQKADHNLIDRVEYVHSDGSMKVVYFNHNLNSVVGSRAQGKSNLLKNIAYSIDPIQCNLRGITTNDFLPLDSFKVFWADAKENTLDDNESKERGILFIPQKYLGGLIYEKDPQFDEFLINLFENKEDFQKALLDYRRFEDENVLVVTSLIREIITIAAALIERSIRLKRLGTSEDHEREIKKIEEKIKTFGKTASVTQSELKDYQKLFSEISEKEKLLSLVSQDIESFKQLSTNEVISSEKVYNLQFSKGTLDKIKQKLIESDQLFKEDFINEEIKLLTERSTQITNDITVLNNKALPLHLKIQKSKALLDLTNILEKEKTTKKQIEDINQERLDLGKGYRSKTRELLNAYLDYEHQYKNFRVDLGKLNFSQVKIVVSFDSNSFSKATEDLINYHNSTKFRKESSKYKNATDFLNNPAQWTYDRDKLHSLLSEIIEGILSGKLLLKSGKDHETALKELFKNRYKIDFPQSLSNKKGVKFPDMSDGEQMLALLEFIFKFDDYNYPVLLDQPEDDLDSRAISTIIVDFIKAQKIGRQIIVATHNANLVVCGDSEEILVSSKKGRKNPDFEYLTGAIEDRYINKEIVDILEGGEIALKKRMFKLNIIN